MGHLAHVLRFYKPLDLYSVEQKKAIANGNIMFTARDRGKHRLCLINRSRHAWV